ncbi:LysR family transcriptional regulator [Palleronia rufa]|uniref:LysR family transcriptional regulator n=1 Tax=Palleronia rufa TaxID=1530186 RepID=UPI00056CDE20|nr:LysR family transcriptional regulator [Palleronia rufa]
MQAQPDWDSLRLFAAVAREGGIMRAAPVAGTSPAILSRRMRQLEADLGQVLFRRGAAAYALTADGRALAVRVRSMEEAAAAIGPGQVQRVRISAGSWTALDLATRMGTLWRPGAGWVPEFVTCDRMLDIARREVGIGIRNRAPDTPWLAGRRTGYVDHAVYATGPDVSGWIGQDDAAPPLPSALWITANHGDAISTRANSPILAAALAEAGLGRMVLPTFIGASRPGLVRIGDPIPELRNEGWLVCHHEGRHLPPVRRALAVLARYLRSRSA